MKTVDQLLAEWEDGRLSAESAAQLKALLATPEGRAALVDHWALSEAIHAILISGVAEQPAAPPLRAKATDKPVPGTLSWRRLFPRLVWREVRISWAWPAAVATVICLLTIGLHLCFQWVPACSIAGLQGSLQLQRAGKQITVSAGQALYSGDRCLVPANSAVELTWGNGASRLELSAGSELQIKNPMLGRKFELRTGSLLGAVASQPLGRPLRFHTPEAEVKVVGTRFSLSVSNNATRLEVLEGTVRFLKTLSLAVAERGEILVKEGQMAVASRDSKFEAQLLRGFLSQEIWAVPAGSSLSDALTKGARVSDFAVTASIPGSNFVGRLRGYLVAPSDGDYTFWISSLNGETTAELWLSSDSSPAKKKRIAFLYGTSRKSGEAVTPSRMVPGTRSGISLASARTSDWQRSPSQKSTPQTLSGGRRYYIEVWQESSRIENLAIGWRLPGEPSTALPTMVDTYALCPYVEPVD